MNIIKNFELIVSITQSMGFITLQKVTRYFQCHQNSVLPVINLFYDFSDYRMSFYHSQRGLKLYHCRAGGLQDSSSMETKGKTSLVENEDSDMGHFVGEHSSPHSHPFSQSEVHISMINCYLCKVKQLLVYRTPTLYFLVGIKSSTLANV